MAALHAGNVKLAVAAPAGNDVLSPVTAADASLRLMFKTPPFALLLNWPISYNQQLAPRCQQMTRAVVAYSGRAECTSKFPILPRLER